MRISKSGKSVDPFFSRLDYKNGQNSSKQIDSLISQFP